MNHQDKAASLVHAAKNRLQLLQPRFDELKAHTDPKVRCAGEQIAHQIHEVNQQLVLMLSLYRLDGAALLHPEELYLVDELELGLANVNDPRISLDCSSDLTFYADRRLFQAVLGDALHNALKYCETRVQVLGRRHCEGVLIQVLDDGLAPAVGSDQEGNGVGLWIANRIAEAHENQGRKGFAGHRFDPELGSCFELFLP